VGRIRTLKPEFFRSRSLAKVSIPARLTFQGLWCEADDFGRGVADPRIVKGSVWPLDDDVTHADVGAHLEELASTGHIRLYVVKGERYFEILSWEEHQSAAYRRGKAQFPEPIVEESAEPAPPEQESHDESCTEVQAARPDVLELGTGKGTGNGDRNAPARRPRAIDPLWEAIIDCWQIDESQLTESERGRLNKATKLLRDVEADPTEIPRRRARYRVRYSHASDTPLAVIGRWSELANDTNGATPTMPAGSDMTQRNLARIQGGQR
jgi:hypothetical protein